MTGTVPSVAAEERSLKLMSNLLISQAIISLALAFWHNTWLEAVLIGLPAAAAPIWIARRTGPGFLARASASAAMMIFSGLYIHQARGMTELHFHVFVSLAVLVVLRDARAIILAGAVIAVHHLLFAVLQMASVPVYIYTTDANPLLLTVIHAVFVVAEVAVLAPIAHSLRKEWKEVDRTALSLEAMQAGDAAAGVADSSLQQVLAVLGSEIQECSKAAKEVRGLMGELRSAADSQASHSQSVLAHVFQTDQAAASLVEAFEQLTRQSQDAAEKVGELRARSAAARQATEEVRLQSQLVGELADDLKKVQSHLLDCIQAAEASAAQASSQANALAGRVEKDLSDAGRQVSELHGSTQGIQATLQAINEIADQTNLLALNAAIEAARAGEAGRGFAVVAEEVRALSQRCREAVAQTEMIIQKMDAGIAQAMAGLVGDNRQQGAIQRTQASVGEIVRGYDVISEQMNTIGQAVSGLEGQVQTAQAIAEAINLRVAESVQETSQAESSAELCESSLAAASEQMKAEAESVQELRAGSKNAAQMMESIAAMGEETAASSDTVLSAASEQLRVLQSVADRIERAQQAGLAA